MANENEKSVGLGGLGFEANGSLVVRLVKRDPMPGNEPRRTPHTLTLEPGDDTGDALNTQDDSLGHEGYPPIDDEARAIIDAAAEIYWTPERMDAARKVRDDRAAKQAEQDALAEEQRKTAEAEEAARFDMMMDQAMKRREAKEAEAKKPD